MNGATGYGAMVVLPAVQDLGHLAVVVPVVLVLMVVLQLRQELVVQDNHLLISQDQ